MSLRVLVPELVTTARGKTPQAEIVRRAKGKFGKGALCYWELGTYTPNHENLLALLEALGVDYDAISLPLDELKKRRKTYPKFFCKKG